MYIEKSWSRPFRWANVISSLGRRSSSVWQGQWCRTPAQWVQHRETVFLPESTRAVHGMCWPLRPGAQSTTGTWPWTATGVAGCSWGKQRCLRKPRKAMLGRERQQLSPQTASEYVTLSTNTCPIKGQSLFLTCYQINFHSDNYSSWRIDYLLQEI